MLLKKQICHYLRHDLGLVGCVGAWGSGFGGWGVVLGLGGLVFCLRGVVLDLRGVGFGNVVLGLGVGQVGFAGWWVGVLDLVGCGDAWGVRFWDWDVVLGSGELVLGLHGVGLGLGF